jgi:pyruvate/2-oxoglutarate dehydrogenase complex dihydrolipoamide dehydrogenase (E3) component
LRKKLMKDFERFGIRLVEGRKARLHQADAAFAGPVELDNGSSIAADLIIPALGSRPVTHPLADVSGVGLASNGRVAVDGWLRPTSRSNLFAFGDMANSGDLMTVAAFVRQIPFLKKALTALASGKRVEDLPAYTPWTISPIVVPIGPKRGASVLPITKNGLVVGKTLTAAAKGKTLLIPGYRKNFGLEK